MREGGGGSLQNSIGDTGPEMPKAADLGSTPTQERRAIGGLSVVMLECARTIEENVNYFDAACEG
jgi:hypothetical protein